MAALPSSNRDVASYDPGASQNYQHYAIELNDGSVPYQKQKLGMGHGPYEMPVEHQPQELDNDASAMGTHNQPQELPTR